MSILALADQNVTFVDIDEVGSGREPAEQAGRLLAEHRSCDRIEVWRGEDRITVVERGRQGHTP